MVQVLAKLEWAAQDAIHHLQQIPEFSNAKIAVVGGMAVMKHTKCYRRSHDIDFITGCNAKERLHAAAERAFRQWPGQFVYDPNWPLAPATQTPDDKDPPYPKNAIQMDFILEWQVSANVPL
ncbi:hypothetical protein A1O3_08178 [Capronia epimyces CBS 606.96]|uniref:Uncharacterized protein n=1 Tax=Capronia epimyces CBS 606.96 TaxID=1182542 RepID=W9XI73_9EURO|nr:uncharacterized protein A1O3_08178 [Capronia epimyces CBS 606.96]EXJ79893.1 hypothetical protein A1O3_08178 [Capronia epimyces CBS 606.96]